MVLYQQISAEAEGGGEQAVLQRVEVQRGQPGGLCGLTRPSLQEGLRVGDPCPEAGAHEDAGRGRGGQVNPS